MSEEDEREALKEANKSPQSYLLQRRSFHLSAFVICVFICFHIPQMLGRKHSHKRGAEKMKIKTPELPETLHSCLLTAHQMRRTVCDIVIHIATQPTRAKERFYRTCDRPNLSRRARFLFAPLRAPMPRTVSIIYLVIVYICAAVKCEGNACGDG